MKKIYKYLFMICTATLMGGCVDDQLVEGSVDNGPLEFYATIEQTPGIEVQSRTVLGGEGKSVSFVDGDKIKIFDGTGNSGAYSTNETEGGYRKFTKVDGNCSSSAASYYAIYPSSTTGAAYSAGNLTVTIPAEQNAPLNSFDPAANVSVAKGDLMTGNKYNLKFKNVGNLLKFNFTADSEVTAIIIKGNSAENLVGKVSVNPTSAEWTGSITNGSNQVTLKPAGGGTFKAGSYYAVILPQTHTGGVSVKMEHGEGSYHFKRGSVSNIQMVRNNIYQLFTGSLTDYKEAAVLPSLYMHNGSPHGTDNKVYNNLVKVDRISFHAMAQDVDWNYADANNVLTVMGTSDVRGYVEGGSVTRKTHSNGQQYDEYSGGTLHIYTKKGMFSIPENDIQAGTSDGTQMFNNYQSITAIDNLSYIDVTFLRSFKNMFYNCDKLQSIDISGWDTSSATDMAGMFRTSSASTPLHDVILGDWFVLANPGGNMFGLNSDNRTLKIRVSCPDEVYQQFEVYTGYATGDELYKKQVTFNQTTQFIEFLNPTVIVTSVNREVNFTFTLGGFYDPSSLGDITVGFDGYTPIGSQFTSIGQQNIDGIDYDMYTLALTADQKHDRRVVAKLQAQDTEKNPTHVILQSTSPSAQAKIESRIYPYAFKGYVDPSFTITGLTDNDWRDYSGAGWPIIGQPCKVTFKLKIDNGMTADQVRLSNGTTNVLCDKSGSPDGEGYQTYITHDPIVASNTCEIKNLKVLVQVESQRMLHEAGTVPVKVYGIKLEDGITSTSPGLSNSQVYVLKCYGTESYLCTGQVGGTNRNSNTASVYAYEQIDNFSFWKFNSNKKLETYNTATQRYFATSTVTNSSSDTYSKVFTLENGTNGLKFKNGSNYLRFTNTSTNKTVTLTSTSGNNEWIVYPVIFTEP